MINYNRYSFQSILMYDIDLSFPASPVFPSMYLLGSRPLRKASLQVGHNHITAHKFHALAH